MNTIFILLRIKPYLSCSFPFQPGVGRYLAQRLSAPPSKLPPSWRNRRRGRRAEQAALLDVQRHRQGPLPALGGGRRQAELGQEQQPDGAREADHDDEGGLERLE